MVGNIGRDVAALGLARYGQDRQLRRGKVSKDVVRRGREILNMRKKRQNGQVIQMPTGRRHNRLTVALRDLQEEKGGQLTPQDIVDYARPEDSPIHTSFDWDNDSAGEKYRLVLARLMLTKIRVTYMGEKQQAYFNATVQIGNQVTRAYFPVERVMTDEAIHRQVLQSAVHELEYAQKKYNSLREFHGLINEKKLKQVKKKHNL